MKWFTRVARLETFVNNVAPHRPKLRAWWRPAVINLGDASRWADAAEWDAITRHASARFAVCWARDERLGDGFEQRRR
jgi:hypothetical protein